MVVLLALVWLGHGDTLRGVGAVLLGNRTLRRDLLRIHIVWRDRRHWGGSLWRVSAVRLWGRDTGRICAVSLVLCGRCGTELRLDHWRRIDGTGDDTSGFLDRSDPYASAADGIDDSIHEDDIVVYECTKEIEECNRFYYRELVANLINCRISIVNATSRETVCLASYGVTGGAYPHEP